MRSFIRDNARPDDSEKLTELEVQLKEMTKTVEKQKEMIANARRDPLTGLRNRDGMSEQINAILKETKEGTFFIMDMDNFKSVNDIYGHMEGDSVLTRFAKALIKATDEDDIIARLGGDEFVIFSPKANDKNKINFKAQRIIKYVERGLVTPGKLMRVTVSIGIAQAPIDGVTYDELYANADLALYGVKNGGKNAYKFYGDMASPGKKTDNRPQISLEEITTKLKEGKMEGSLVVEYSNFEKIYRFIERNLIRDKREVQCALFTIDDDTDDEEKLRTQLEHLQNAVVSSLRKGDVTSTYSSSQVLTLLMDVDKENADMVVNRIIERYREKAGENAMKIEYDIQQLALNEQ